MKNAKPNINNNIIAFIPKTNDKAKEIKKMTIILVKINNIGLIIESDIFLISAKRRADIDDALVVRKYLYGCPVIFNKIPFDISLHIRAVNFSITINLISFAEDPSQLRTTNINIRIIACSSKELLKTLIPGKKSFNSFPTKLPANLAETATIPISIKPLKIEKGKIIVMNELTRFPGRILSNLLSL